MVLLASSRLHQRVLGHGLVEQQRGRVHDLLGLDGLQRLQRLFVDAAVGQRLGVGQSQVGAEEGRQLPVLDQRRAPRSGRRSSGRAPRRAASWRRGCPGESVSVTLSRTGRSVGPDVGERLLRGGVGLADALEPLLGLRAGGFRGRRPQGAEGGDLLRLRRSSRRQPAPGRSHQEEGGGQRGDSEPASELHLFFPL